MRIIEGHLDIQMSDIAPPETLGHMHGFTAGMPEGVQRRTVIEAARLNDEGVAFPAARGISEISVKFKGGREFASIRERF